MSPVTRRYNNLVAVVMAVEKQKSENALEWRWVLLLIERMTRDGAEVGSLEVAAER
jgi:hypothetical protein